MSDGEPTPVYFGDDSSPLFGWVHRPDPGTPVCLAVVICNPFGHEALSSHRALRDLAKRCADDRMVALRFDYEGTGNSSGDTHELGRAASWRDNVLTAIRFMRRIAPGIPVTLVGLRLGALIALDAALQADPLAALIMIAPPKSGRQFLREMRALQATNGGVDADAIPALAEDTAGFSVSAELRGYIESLELSGEPLSSVGRLFVVEREELPLGARALAALESRLRPVEIRSLNGAADLLVEPHEVKPPEAILMQTLAWLNEVGETSAAIGSAMPVDLPSEPRAIISSGGRSFRVRESPVFVDPEHRLFGILTEPLQFTSPPRVALVLVSSGAVPTDGPNRVYASIARRLATAGIAVLRFDVAGIGDSDPHAGEPANVVYSKNAPSDVATAVRYLQARGLSRVVAGGICAGGYHALQAAVAGAPVAGVAVINPLTFHYVHGTPLAAQPHSAIDEARRQRRSMRSAAAWRKLLTGKVGIGRTLNARTNIVQSWIMSHVRDALRHTRWRRADDVGYDFEILTKGGVALNFIFAGDDPGPVLLADFGGSAARRLHRTGALHITTIDGADHTFTARHFQRELADIMATILSGDSDKHDAEPGHARHHAFC